MNEEEREQRREMLKYFGSRELFRFIGFFMGWIFLGLIIGIILIVVLDVNENIFIAVFLAFLLTAFAFPIVARYWKPANSLLNKVFGNKNLSIPIIPLSTVRLIIQKRPWYYYLASIWGWLLLITLLYLVIQYFTK